MSPAFLFLQIVGTTVLMGLATHQFVIAELPSLSTQRVLELLLGVVAVRYIGTVALVPSITSASMPAHDAAITWALAVAVLPLVLVAFVVVGVALIKRRASNVSARTPTQSQSGRVASPSRQTAALRVLRVSHQGSAR